MDPQFPKEIVSWCFAAAVAWFLLKWVTTSITTRLNSQEQATNNNTLVQLELYRLFLIHDAQTRGVQNRSEEEMTASHRLAFDEYQKINESLSNLKEKLKS